MDTQKSISVKPRMYDVPMSDVDIKLHPHNVAVGVDTPQKLGPSAGNSSRTVTRAVVQGVALHAVLEGPQAILYPFVVQMYKPRDLKITLDMMSRLSAHCASSPAMMEKIKLIDSMQGLKMNEIETAENWGKVRMNCGQIAQFVNYLVGGSPIRGITIIAAINGMDMSKYHAGTTCPFKYDPNHVLDAQDRIWHEAARCFLNLVAVLKQDQDKWMDVLVKTDSILRTPKNQTITEVFADVAAKESTTLYDPNVMEFVKQYEDMLVEQHGFDRNKAETQTRVDLCLEAASKTQKQSWKEIEDDLQKCKVRETIRQFQSVDLPFVRSSRGQVITTAKQLYVHAPAYFGPLLKRNIVLQLLVLLSLLCCTVSAQLSDKLVIGGVLTGMIATLVTNARIRTQQIENSYPAAFNSLEDFVQATEWEQTAVDYYDRCNPRRNMSFRTYSDCVFAYDNGLNSKQVDVFHLVQGYYREKFNMTIDAAFWLPWSELDFPYNTTVSYAFRHRLGVGQYLDHCRPSSDFDYYVAKLPFGCDVNWHLQILFLILAVMAAFVGFWFVVYLIGSIICKILSIFLGLWYMLLVRLKALLCTVRPFAYSMRGGENVIVTSTESMISTSPFIAVAPGDRTDGLVSICVMDLSTRGFIVGGMGVRIKDMLFTALHTLLAAREADYQSIFIVQYPERASFVEISLADVFRDMVDFIDVACFSLTSSQWGALGTKSARTFSCGDVDFLTGKTVHKAVKLYGHDQKDAAKYSSGLARLGDANTQIIHSSSTLKGFSGTPVFDVSSVTPIVIGIHTGVYEMGKTNLAQRFLFTLVMLQGRTRQLKHPLRAQFDWAKTNYAPRLLIDAALETNIVILPKELESRIGPNQGSWGDVRRRMAQGDYGWRMHDGTWVGRTTNGEFYINVPGDNFLTSVDAEDVFEKMPYMTALSGDDLKNLINAERDYQLDLMGDNFGDDVDDSHDGYTDNGDPGDNVKMSNFAARQARRLGTSVGFSKDHSTWETRLEKCANEGERRLCLLRKWHRMKQPVVRLESRIGDAPEFDAELVVLDTLLGLTRADLAVTRVLETNLLKTPADPINRTKYESLRQRFEQARNELEKRQQRLVRLQEDYVRMVDERRDRDRGLIDKYDDRLAKAASARDSEYAKLMEMQSKNIDVAVRDAIEKLREEHNKKLENMKIKYELQVQQMNDASDRQIDVRVERAKQDLEKDQLVRERKYQDAVKLIERLIPEVEAQKTLVKTQTEKWEQQQKLQLLAQQRTTEESVQKVHVLEVELSKASAELKQREKEQREFAAQKAVELNALRDVQAIATANVTETSFLPLNRRGPDANLGSLNPTDVKELQACANVYPGFPAESWAKLPMHAKLQYWEEMPMPAGVRDLDPALWEVLDVQQRRNYLNAKMNSERHPSKYATERPTFIHDNVWNTLTLTEQKMQLMPPKKPRENRKEQRKENAKLPAQKTPQAEKVQEKHQVKQDEAPKQMLVMHVSDLNKSLAVWATPLITQTLADIGLKIQSYEHTSVKGQAKDGKEFCKRWIPVDEKLLKRLEESKRIAMPTLDLLIAKLSNLLPLVNDPYLTPLNPNLMLVSPSSSRRVPRRNTAGRRGRQ